MKKYGLPYKGSKSKIASQIVGMFPKAENLYDLFCGGCAISHFALTTHKFSKVYANDINWMCPTLFADVLEGKYDNDTRWISREDFYRLKDTDPYVAFVWSFGNNLRDYIYGKEIESVKKAFHYVIYEGDNSYAKEIGEDLSDICLLRGCENRYRAIKKRYAEVINILGDTKHSSEGAQSSPSDIRVATNMQVEHYCRHNRLLTIGGG